MDALLVCGCDSEISDDNIVMKDIANGKSASLNINSWLVVAPSVETRSDIRQVAMVDRKTKEIKSNPTFEELFKPESGPVNPFKTEKQRAQKNTLTGYRRQVFSSVYKCVCDIDGYTGPWSKYENEKTIAKPTPELQKDMDAFVKNKQEKSRRYKKEQKDNEQKAEESSSKTLKTIKELYWCQSSKKTMFLKDVIFQTKTLLQRTFERPVREVAFNNDATQFLSASFDRYVKLWDTETEQVMMIKITCFWLVCKIRRFGHIGEVIPVDEQDVGYEVELRKNIMEEFLQLPEGQYFDYVPVDGDRLIDEEDAEEQCCVD
ncbi:unnamed protein product [Caenorhabditis angaria]|uniref:Uncharacterized protein n=1 Tax=Caenorhabditis angaria TaxID=860376 RepID=A0A9P1IRK1_9PELO|nr:unnamed protein product [Caenorhabditis angaria]